MKYSQVGQDICVIEEVYKKKRNGFFVDVGASHGINLSNTYLLEKDYGWNGICIEPHPRFFEKLVKNRTAKCVQCAAYSEGGQEVEFVVAGVLSGIADHIDFHKSALDKEKIVVATERLTDILDRHDAPCFIDYLSLDTEGSELEVLKGTDLNKYTFGFITVEHNWVEPRRSEIRDLLLKYGYAFYREERHDDYYMHKSIK